MGIKPLLSALILFTGEIISVLSCLMAVSAGLSTLGRWRTGWYQLSKEPPDLEKQVP